MTDTELGCWAVGCFCGRRGEDGRRDDAILLKKKKRFLHWELGADTRPGEIREGGEKNDYISCWSELATPFIHNSRYMHRDS